MSPFPGARIDLLNPTAGAARISRVAFVVGLVMLIAASAVITIGRSMAADLARELDQLKQEIAGGAERGAGKAEQSRGAAEVERELGQAERELAVPWNRRLLIIDELAAQGVMVVRWTAAVGMSDQQVEVWASSIGGILDAAKKVNRDRVNTTVVVSGLLENLAGGDSGATARLRIAGESGFEATGDGPTGKP